MVSGRLILSELPSTRPPTGPRVGRGHRQRSGPSTPSLSGVPPRLGRTANRGASFVLRRLGSPCRASSRPQPEGGDRASPPPLLGEGFVGVAALVPPDRQDRRAGRAHVAAVYALQAV